MFLVEALAARYSYTGPIIVGFICPLNEPLTVPCTIGKIIRMYSARPSASHLAEQASRLVDNQRRSRDQVR